MSVLRDTQSDAVTQSDASVSGPAMICRSRLALAFFACGLVVASAQAQQPREFQGGAVPHSNVPPQSLPSQAPQPEAQPEQPAPAPSYQPGFLDVLGRWFGDSKSAFDSQLKSTQEAIGTMGSQARDAAGSVVAIPGTRVITGRQLCPPASNGAPDCQRGVDALCRAKGFQTGRSLDVTSAQRCPARVYIENRPPKEGECRMETFVTRAVCQ